MRVSMSNIDGLQRLIYLCQIKNDLNRKRRRFYYLQGDKAFPNAFKSYRKCQTEMKAMTQGMRKMRVEMGVRFIWSNGGLINAIELANGERLKQRSFKRYHEAELFEMELFDGRK